MHAFSHGVLQKAERLPGVESAAVSGYHPLDPGCTNSFRIIGRESEAATQPELSVRRVTPGYFPTMGVPLVRGRLLTDADYTSAPPSGVSRLVVSQGMTLALRGAVIGVTPTDPFTFVVVPLGLALVALVASYLPARRATRVDPVTALRAD